MGRPQATQISKRIAKTLVTQVADSTEELARALDTSNATILRIRATGMITLTNLKKLVCFYFFPIKSLQEITVNSKKLASKVPSAVKLFTEHEDIFYNVSILHKEDGEFHINVLWKEDFEVAKNHRFLLNSLQEIGYHYLIVIDQDDMPKLYSIQDLQEKLLEPSSTSLNDTSTEALVKVLSERGYKVTLEIMSEINGNRLD